MTKKIAFIMLGCMLVPNFGYAACSRANLLRCLDSACANNVSSNPAARCQYCGCADAGEPTETGMRSVSVGSSSRFTISTKDLKNAPADPGQRYVWASKKCIEMVNGCSADDVSETYDSLIEQSCTATGISSQLNTQLKHSAKPRSSQECKTEITKCISGDTKCDAQFSACAADADFDKFFSECSVLATGCDDFLTKIRTDLKESRDNAIKSAEEALEAIIVEHRADRDREMATITASCADETAREACIAQMCNRIMPNKCTVPQTGDKDKMINGREIAPEQVQRTVKAEIAMATQLCEYYDAACSKLK